MRTLVFLARLGLGLIFFTAGMSKLLDGQFPGIIGPVWLEDALAPHGLALFAQFVAWSQVLIGLLLMTQRFATLGAIMVLPMILNIWMVTISQNWKGTPYVIAFFFATNLFLLAADWHRLKFLIHPDPKALAQLPGLVRNWRGDMLWAVGLLLILGSVGMFFVLPVLCYVMVVVGLVIMFGVNIWTGDTPRNEGSDRES
ncbi:DoxX family membrane protein [Pontibacter sp. G13]|uniref:DoxX family membrane protein n=1 Tax=Pontibacter sp. G13 TaxID=3074898 RepID=UPI00288A1410|nr:DoxX family membrane protein [Pontibacter sp. G13]WNJ17827.1 DoxX family membrane protein [Pontibacter sp. G13]